MRKIKFRAWNEKLKMMSPPFRLNELVAGYAGEILVIFKEGELSEEVENCVLMQYIGLKDKNGKEIYEGDIVREKGDIDLYKIEFSIDGNHCYYAGYNIEDGSLETVIELFNFGEVEVIGNIYENPELLKGVRK